jgi:tetratricopeptide (TPR) repeat protein
MSTVLDGTNTSTASSSASGYDIFTTLASQWSQQSALASNALSSGLAFYQKKDYAKAAGELQRSIALDPTNTQTYNFLANTYLQQKKTGEAVKIYKASLAIDTTQDTVHTSLANVYMSQKQYNDAEKEFKAAIKLNPADTVAPYTLGQMYQQMGRFTDAENQFKKVIRMAPKDANPLYALGTAYNKEGKYADAVKQLTQTVKLKPKMAAAHLELGIAYAALGDTVNAQHEVETLTRLDAAQGALLQASITQPKMVSAGGGLTDNFSTALASNSPVYALDVSLLQPNTSKEFSLTFSFDSKMDPASVQDPNNWTINKASGGVAGYYNNLMSILPTEAYIPQNPTRVSYDPDQQQATVTFMLSQNANGDATIDPSHMVFKFDGKSLNGKTMDPTANEFEGAAQLPF